MPRQVDAYELFIASPGGLDDERNAVRDEIAKFNELFMYDLGAAFTARGWEDVPGGMSRAQGLINDVIRKCDYTILILGSRWGTAPALDGKFTSGTEEEYSIARECVSKAELPMVDILVLFKGVPDSQLSDPGEQLSKVLSFKKGLEESKELLYKTFDDLDGLRHEVRARLHGWVRTRGVANIAPRSVGDQLAAGDSAKRNAGSVPEDGQSVDPLELAESFESKGLMTQAEAAYAKAVADNDVDSLEKYARFLRRTGRLAKSLEINERILAQLASADDALETTDKRVRILVSIGIVQRKMGDLSGSRKSLYEAVQTAQQGGTEALSVMSYALDNLGITADRAGDSALAVDCFRRSLSARQDSGDVIGQARSLTNLARVYRKSGSASSAAEACAEAINILEPLEDRSPLAAAYAAMGEILEAGSDLSGAERAYKLALQINEQLGMPDKISMSLIQVARMLIERGELDAAERHAERSLEENEKNSNREGIAASKHLLGRISGAMGNGLVAIGLLEEAADAFAAMKNPTGEAWARFHLSQVQRELAQEVEADISLARAQSLARVTRNAQLTSLIELSG